MLQYKNLIYSILWNGQRVEDRTGVGTISIFGASMSFDLEVDFPLVTMKHTYFKGVVDELLWFLSGSTNVNDLPERSRHWWTPWAGEDGELGPIYGEQWRRQQYCNPATGQVTYKDQLDSLMKGLKEDPHSRRHVVNLWHGAAMDQAKLPCCHGSIVQFYVRLEEGKTFLDCGMYQRSCDVFVGLPVNIASYALLTCLLAKYCGYTPGKLNITLGDTHLYVNHLEQVDELLDRRVLPPPSLVIDPIGDFTKVTASHIHLLNYQYHPAIKVPVAV